MLPIEYTIKEHVENANASDFDSAAFAEKVSKKLHSIQKEYSPFITLQGNFELPKRKGSLYDVPIAVKDNLCTSGMRTTAGSKILDNYVPQFDAISVSRAKLEGGMIVGKTAMDEFGFGSFSTNCAYSIPKNPLDKDRTCGGSSGGAAAVVAAADFPIASIAESTGGSITCPAAFTGTVGITPTYGRVSRWGLVDYASSLDKVGVVAKHVHDAALILRVISGLDELDTTSSGREVPDYAEDASHPIEKARLAVPKEYFGEGVDDDVSKEVWRAIKLLESNGYTYEEVSLPSTDVALPAYYIISMTEASTNLAKFSGLRYGMQSPIEGNADHYFAKVRSEFFGEEAKRRIILGTYMRMAGYRAKYYLKAMQIRTKIINEFKQHFKKFDAVIAPSMPVIPPKFSEISEMQPVNEYMMDILTVAPNLAGMPTISLPFGKVGKFPIGVQLIADHFEESKLLGIAAKLEVLS